MKRKPRDKADNPVAMAVFKTRIMKDVAALKTMAELQTEWGGDAHKVIEEFGRLAFMCHHAAGLHGLQETPEYRMIRASAGALLELRKRPETLEQVRPTLSATMAAIDRLLPKLTPIALAAGALEFDNLLHEAQNENHNKNHA